MKTEPKAFHIDRDFVTTHDLDEVMEPVRWRANIYDGPLQYEASLAGFSCEQRWLFAVDWYQAEVNNGGHDQFYSNSTGLVWPDALAGLHAIGAEEAAALLQESADRLGGSPSLSREERGADLARLAPDFNDLDTRFYALGELDAPMKTFMRAHPDAFLFDGIVEVTVPEAGGRRGIDDLMDALMAVMDEAKQKADRPSAEGPDPDGN